MKTEETEENGGETDEDETWWYGARQARRTTATTIYILPAEFGCEGARAAAGFRVLVKREVREKFGRERKRSLLFNKLITNI
jgi:hypothetical protein